MPQHGCAMCRGTAFWVSVHGQTVCERCHPPADEALVARRFRADELDKAGKPDKPDHTAPIRHVA